MQTSRPQVLHRQLDDNKLLTKLSDGSLDPKLFSHEAHLRLAFVLIKHYGLEGAINECQQILKNYVEHIGAADKYDAKLSERAIMVVNKLMRKHNYDNVYDLIHIHPKLLSDFKSYLYEYAD